MEKSKHPSAQIHRRFRVVETAPDNPLIPERFTWWDGGEECVESPDAYEARLSGFLDALELVLTTQGLDLEALRGDAEAVRRTQQERELERLLSDYAAPADTAEHAVPRPLRLVRGGGEDA